MGHDRHGIGRTSLDSPYGMGPPPDVVHMDHGWIELIHEGLQTPDRRSALKECERFSPGGKAQRMSGHCDRVKLLSERARSWTGHMRLPLVTIECLQQCDQIAFRPTDGFNPMHVQNSRDHYLSSV